MVMKQLNNDNQLYNKQLHLLCIPMNEHETINTYSASGGHSHLFSPGNK